MNTTGEVNPKNRHCLRGLAGKYGHWDEMLRDILYGKLKIVQNKKWAESETDDDDEDEDDEVMPGRNWNTNSVRHIRKKREIRANTDQSGRGHATTTHRQRNAE